MKDRHAVLRDIVNRWDPIGVFGFREIDWPKNEYDCVVEPLMSLLRSGKTTEEITQYLERQVRDHFGVEVVPGKAARCADEAFTWFHRRFVN